MKNCVHSILWLPFFSRWVEVWTCCTVRLLIHSVQWYFASGTVYTTLSVDVEFSTNKPKIMVFQHFIQPSTAYQNSFLALVQKTEDDDEHEHDTAFFVLFANTHTHKLPHCIQNHDRYWIINIHGMRIKCTMNAGKVHYSQSEICGWKQIIKQMSKHIHSTNRIPNNKAHTHARARTQTMAKIPMNYSIDDKRQWSFCHA